jgi:hypothetical protein
VQLTSAEEVLDIIRGHPEAIVEALEKKPELLTSLILRLAPWDRFATKEDIRMLLDFMEKRFSAIDKRFEDVNKRFEAVDRRFEDMNRRFEDINRRFEDMNGRFEDLMSYSDKRFEELRSYSDRRFEDMNRRFEDMMHYVDKRVGSIEKLLIGFNVPILVAVITILLKLVL